MIKSFVYNVINSIFTTFNLITLPMTSDKCLNVSLMPFAMYMTSINLQKFTHIANINLTWLIAHVKSSLFLHKISVCSQLFKGYVYVSMYWIQRFTFYAVEFFNGNSKSNWHSIEVELSQNISIIWHTNRHKYRRNHVQILPNNDNIKINEYRKTLSYKFLLYSNLFFFIFWIEIMKSLINSNFWLAPS